MLFFLLTRRRRKTINQPFNDYHVNVHVPWYHSDYSRIICTRSTLSQGADFGEREGGEKKCERRLYCLALINRPPRKNIHSLSTI